MPATTATDGRSGGTDTSTDADDEGRTVRRTRRWQGVVAVVLLAVAVGVLAKRPSVLLVGAVGVAFAAYPRLTGPPDADLSISRQITPEHPDAGDVVEVTTTVRNEGDDPIFDLRLVDGVPPMATVEDGSPRLATALRAGEAATVEYSIEVDRTTHRFRPMTVVARDPSGASEMETTISEETTIEGVGHVPDVPLRAQSRRRSGRLITDQGGSGIEFHRTRDYEPGDPVNRIDWRQYARTGELSSIDFREERLAEVVVCVDARAEAYRAASPDDPHAVAYAIGSAGRIGEALFAANHQVGLAAFGRDLCWLPPGAGNDHEDRYYRYLAADSAFDVVPPAVVDRPAAEDRSGDDGSSLLDALPGFGGDDVDVGSSLESQLATIRPELGATTQVVLLTPLSDDESSRIAQLLESSGAAVTVITPDITNDESVGGRLATVERENRIHALRNSGVPVVDWNPDERLGTAVAAAGVNRA
ncbi:DUF58 domain-containing protein [Natronomonas salina]|uniref:DUF58 domain-containing protein n=1 Tax=Natronomonas salina TaxID=1710540 RepID=UPI0015B511D7|nr:DUF58 domain-containing protein [Natronomonas salina]QLD90446.1 DUF58 domain-containing protein [Natronomonas salina]